MKNIEPDTASPIPQNNLDKCFSPKSGPVSYVKQYAEYLQKILSQLDHGQIAAVGNCFLDARKRNATIFFIGNGGSAATASHFAQDLQDCARKAKRSGFKTLSLTDNISFISALANDFGYDTIFTGQMSELFQKGDVLVSISASGNSPNILAAVKLAKAREGVCVGFTGFDGGKLAELSDFQVHIATPKGEYGPVESMHVTIAHMISSYIYYALKNE